VLKKRALGVTIWSGTDLLLRQGTQFLTMMILARLLLPADFGVIAMLSLPMGIAALLTDGGLSTVLVQRKHITEAHKSSTFYFNITAGILATIGIFTAAPGMSRLLNSPELIAPMRIAAFSCLFAAFSPVHSALLTRDLQFSTLAKASAFAATGSALIAVLLAMNNMGVKTLAYYSVSMAALTTSALWWLSPWRPRARFHWQTFRSMYGFGAYNVGTTLVDTFYNRILAPIIGRMYGTTQIGFYSQADTIRQLPSNFLSSTVARAAFPLLSSMHSESPEIQRRALQFAIRVTTLLNAPLALGMAAASDLLVTLMLGPRWQPAAPIFTILCLANLVQPLNALNIQVLLAQGQAKLVFKIEIIKKFLGLTLLFTCIPFGLEVIAWGQVALAMLSFPINAMYIKSSINYGVFDQAHDALPCIAIAGATALISSQVATKFSSSSSLIELAVTIATMAITYLALLILFKVTAWNEALALLRTARS